MNTVTLIEITGEEPVTVEEMKLFCHVDSDDEDEIFPTMISAARQYAEHYTGRKLIKATYEIALDNHEETKLSLIPCLELLSVKVDGVELENNTLWSFTPSAVGREPLFAVFKPLEGFPDGNIVLTVSAGATTEAERQWIRVRVNNWYEQRATFGIGPNFHEFHHDFVDALLDTTAHYGGF